MHLTKNIKIHDSQTYSTLQKQLYVILQLQAGSLKQDRKTLNPINPSDIVVKKLYCSDSLPHELLPVQCIDAV